MKARNLLHASPPKAQKRQGVCLFECAGLRVGVFRLKYRRFWPKMASYIGL